MLYDRNFDKNLSLHQGSRSFGKKIAVFLIYQPKGLPESVYLTVDHLIESGFDPVVVSNCPLLSCDVERLKCKSSLIIERKNFGYDFGGYRDASFLLREKKVNCEQVLYLNDSVWFPVFDKSPMLREMSESEADYVGTQVFGEAKGGYFDGFFGSYCFLLKKPILFGEAFNEFWDNYKLSSSKEVVLRRGERRFSREMLKACDKSTAIYSLERFSQTLYEMSSADVDQALQDLIVWDVEIAARKSELLMASRRDEEWLLNARQLILLLSRSKNFIGSSPIVSLTRLGFPMIKKNNEILYTMARKSIVDAIDSGRISGLSKIVESEIRKKVLAN